MQVESQDIGQAALSGAASQLAAETGIDETQATSTNENASQQQAAGSSTEAAADATSQETASAAEATTEAASTSSGSGIGSDSDDVKQTRLKFAQMQAQMEANIQEVENKRLAQQAAFEQQDSDDPAAQLQGLMNAQASLKRMTSAFSSKPND